MRDDAAYEDRVDDDVIAAGGWPWHPRWRPWLNPTERILVQAMEAQIRNGKAPTGQRQYPGRGVPGSTMGKRFTITQRHLRHYQKAAA